MRIDGGGPRGDTPDWAHEFARSMLHNEPTVVLIGGLRMDATPISERLRRLRLDAGATIEELSERSGVSVRGISDIERGVSATPRRRTLLALAEGLALDTSARRWLLRPTSAEIQAEPVSSPAPLGDFVGRHQELLRLADLALTGGLAIISGPPGIGKTALAIESTRGFESESPVAFVDLVGHGSSPAESLDVLRSLLLQADRDGRLPSDLESAIARWRAVCADVQPVVVLDNAGQEKQVRAVMASGIRALVVTSRRKLAGLTATLRIVVPTFPLEDGIRLLDQIIPGSQSSPAAVRELALLCNGNPLALRIAGNHVASRPGSTAADFASRLRSEQRRIALLVAGDLSVEAAFTLSYDALDPPSAVAFRSLSMIEGRTFDSWLAAAAADDEVDRVEDHLDRLTEAGFLDATDGNRYQMHDLTRLFGRSRLAREGEEQQVRSRLRLRLMAKLQSAAALFVTADASRDDEASREAAAVWIRREVEHWWPAFEDAAHYGDHRVVVDIAMLFQEGFTHLWIGWGKWTELFAAAVESARALDDDRLIARLLGTLHWASVVERRSAFDGIAISSEIIERAQRADDGVQLAWGYYHRALALVRRRRIDDALTALKVAQDAFTLHAGASFARETAALEAAIHAQEGDIDHARRLIEDVFAHIDEHPLTARQRNAQLASLEEVARIASEADAHDLAISAATTQLALALQTKSDSVVARALLNRARILLAAAHLEDAADDVASVRATVDRTRLATLSPALIRVLLDLESRVRDARDVPEF